MAKISAVLNTYNASQHLDRVLDSLSVFDEILVCDMESTDDTVEIARRHGCRVVTFERGEHRICEPARDFAIHAAANEWVLVVDADEVVPEALTRFLFKLVEAPDCPDAMFVPRSNLFLGKRYYNTTDYQLRFMRKDKAYWPPVIHSHPKIDGTIGKIPRKHKDLYLIHLDDSPLDKRYQKMNSYTDYELQRRLSKNYGVASFMFRPAWFFFRSYILHGGCCDGVRGIIRAYSAMTYQVMLMSKIMERRFSQDSKKKMSKTIAEPFSVDEERKDVIHKGRNTLTLARWQDKDVVVKDFGRPLLRGWEYALRKSKARRSFENARTLLQRGIDTPAPIAYRERRSSLTNRLEGCAYICLYEPSQSLLDFYDTADAAFIHTFAAFVAGLHDKGIRHDDLNNTNIRVTASDGGYRFSLIDLNRMHIYPEGQAVPVDQCFDNITRFSCLDDTFVAFLDQYIELRGLPSSLRDKALEIKRRHDANTDRKKKLKRLI